MDNRNWIFVSGGSRGIGKGIVERLCKSSYEVIYTYRSSSQEAAAMDTYNTSQGFFSKGYQCDCSDHDAVSSLAQTLISERGSPYALINNCGITSDALLQNMTQDEWRRVLACNLDSAFYVNKAFVNSMIESGSGVILHISSVSSIMGSPGQTNYSASKSAINALVKSLALEVSRFDIRVNAIAPGFISTEMLETMPSSEMKTIKKRVPMRRVGDVENVSSLAEYLLSKEASYITGQTIVVDGGLSV